MERGSKENFILFFRLVGAAVLLVVTAAILIGYFFVRPKPHLAVGLGEGAVVEHREAGRPEEALAQAGGLHIKKEFATFLRRLGNV